MKILILLLAFLAAASSLSSDPPPSDHCRTYLNKIKCFWKLPPGDVFKFSSYSQASWFKATSYATVMKKYPGDKGEEMTETEFRADCARSLRIRAEEIKNDMIKHKIKWLSAVRSELDKYKEGYRSDLEDFTTTYDTTIPEPYSKEIKDASLERINAFNSRVDDMKNTASKTWLKAHGKIYQRVLAFHAKIIKAAVEAYKTRAQKIIHFLTALNKRIGSYVSKYEKELLDLVGKKTEAYQKLQMKAFGVTSIDTPIGKKIHDVVRNYELILKNLLRARVKKYHQRLNTCRDGLIKQYGIAYQITANTGRFSFSSNFYASYCHKLGNWWEYKVEKHMKNFRYTDYKMTYKKREYSNLATCDASTVNEPIIDFEKKTKAQGDSAIAKAKKVFEDWKIKWTKIHADMCAKYLDIIKKRHQLLLDGFKASLYCRYGYWCAQFQRRYENYEHNLLKRQNTAMVSFKGALQSRYDNGCHRFAESLQKYEVKVNDLVDKVIAAYKSCMYTRLEKIEEYEQSVIDKRNEFRQKLGESLLKTAMKKCDQYTELICFYHGDTKYWDRCVQTLWIVYKYKMDAKIVRLCDEFDNHWKDLLPRLVHHYECTYKCGAKAKFNCPKYKFNIFWKIVNPTEESYPFRLKYYRTFRGYSLKKVKGRYYWTNK